MELDKVLHPEGLIEVEGTQYDYTYFLKDHLGNTRAVITDADGDGYLDNNIDEILQTDDYYPSGLSFSDGLGGDIKYRYNGKELQDEQIGGVSLDWYDYGARFYDPAIGRFHTQDRFSEKYYFLSNYQYAANNPILFIDVNGDSIYWNSSGRETRKKKKEINAMRNDSESFNLLYSFFESSEEYHITIEVNDKKVDDRAKEQGSSEEDAKKYEGFYSPEGSITLRSNASSTAISEEFFHGFQRQYMYNNTRNSSEIESEAKLFNYTVRGELYPDVPAGRSGLDSYFPLISGNSISNKNAYSIYKQYIDAYNRLSEQTPDHPYSKYKVRYLAPHAYNYLMYLKNQK